MAIAPAPDPATGSDARPFIPPDVKLPEFTLRAVILGVLLGVVFGASSLYLVLKVGMTVSASIPVAVISLSLFRLWARCGGRDATVLENNIVQTAGSAGESIAFGIGVTMPAIMILGMDLQLTRVAIVGVFGALLGILMMIPLRRALIVQEHGKLKYPEGTACAEVLKAGADDASRAASRQAAGVQLAQPAGAAIFGGFGVGLLYSTAMRAFRAWKDTPGKVFGPPLAGGSISAEISPELLGVGYIIGPRISCIMAAGGFLSYLVLIPLIKFFGAAASGTVAPGDVPIKDMDLDAVRSAYILYIGAGAVAAGGIISLFRSMPLIWRGLCGGLGDLGVAAKRVRDAAARTEQDLPMKFVLMGCLALVAAIWAAPPMNMNLVGAALIVVFGFLFVTVSSRLTGEIGSSSNPISGMTVATLLLTCLVFLLAGWTGVGYYVTALSVGGVVCVAASNGGTTSQDLKTGFLLGSTPKFQQIAIMIGAAVSAVALGPILLALNTGGTVYVPAAKVAPGLRAPANAVLDAPERLAGPQAASDTASYRVWQKTDFDGGRPGKYFVNETGAAVYFVDPGINGAFSKRPDGSEVRKYSAPKAVLVSYIIKGILSAQLPWALVLFGVMISIVLELCGVSSLAFAVGVYLPISSSTPLLVGGVVRWLVDRRARAGRPHLSPEQVAAENDRGPGVLLASGYIAGGAITGIIIAFMAGVFDRMDNQITQWAAAHNPFYAGPHSDCLALIPFAALVLLLFLVGRRRA
jgi:putative OPT family oligopeptide transporter